MSQAVQIFERAGEVAHVYTTTGAAPMRPVIAERDATDQPVALTLHEMVLSDPGKPMARFVPAAELHAALVVEQDAPKFRADAAAELRALRLERKEARS